MKQFISTVLLFIADALTVVLAVVLAYYIRESLNSVIQTEFSMPLDKYVQFYILYIAVLGLFIYEGIYTKRYDFWEEYKNILKALAAAFVIIFTYLSLTKSAQQYSRLYFVVLFVTMPLLFAFVKPFVKRLLCKLNIWEKKIYVTGDPIQAGLLKKEFATNGYLGYKLSNEKNAQVVLIATKGIGPGELKQQLQNRFQSKKEVIVVPYLNNYNIANTTVYELFNAHTSLLSIENKLLVKHNRFIKGVFEYFLIFLSLPLLAVVIAAVGVWIKLDSNGSMFFKQRRLGQDGRVFTCWKFRTMYTNQEELLRAYLKRYPQEEFVYERYHKYTNDPRITKAGKWIRKFSLDELPQVFNILLRQMSLIGPRPYMEEERAKLKKHEDTILQVKPGITGLWQVSGRSELEFEQRIDLDVWYIQNWNLWMDVIVFFKTFKVLLLPKGAK